MGVERGLAANTLCRVPAGPGPLRQLPRRRRAPSAPTRSPGTTSPASSRRSPTDPTAVRRWVSARQPAPWWPSADCTSSGPWKASRPTDPASDVHPPMPGKRLPKAISVDEVTRILEAAGTDTATGLRDRALLEFLYSTGARISEAVGLDVDDISAAGDDDGRRSGHRPAFRQRVQGTAGAAGIVRRPRPGRLPGPWPAAAGRQGQGHAGAVPERPRRHGSAGKAPGPS